MQTFFLSAGAIALAEIGDKTQLLSLTLAARFRKPLPIIAGMFIATLISHMLAGGLGQWLGALLTPALMRWALAASFIALGIWMLIPDQLNSGADNTERTRQLSIFGTTAATFFIAEMGDKTQLATAALAARYHDYSSVVMGTTLGMMLANVPVILAGDRFAPRLPVRLVQRVAAIIFIALGIFAWLGIGT